MPPTRHNEQDGANDDERGCHNSRTDYHDRLPLDSLDCSESTGGFCGFFYAWTILRFSDIVHLYTLTHRRYSLYARRHETWHILTPSASRRECWRRACAGVLLSPTRIR